MSLAWFSHPVVLQHLGHTLLLREGFPINRAADRACWLELWAPRSRFPLCFVVITVEMEKILASCKSLCETNFCQTKFGFSTEGKQKQNLWERVQTVERMFKMSKCHFNTRLETWICQTTFEICGQAWKEKLPSLNANMKPRQSHG